MSHLLVFLAGIALATDRPGTFVLLLVLAWLFH